MVIGAVFSKEAIRAAAVFVQDVHERVSVLGETGCVDNYFIVFLHVLDEFNSARPYKDVHFELLSVHFHRQNDRRLLRGLERGVHQSFVEVKDQGFLSLAPWTRRSEEPPLVFTGVLLPGSDRRWRSNNSRRWDSGFTLPLVHLGDQTCKFLGLRVGSLW